MERDAQSPWNLLYLHAGIRAWWLAEYGCWYGENHDPSLSSARLDEGKKQKIILSTELTHC